MERIRYTPPPEFYDELCSDASDRVGRDLGSMDVEFDRGDMCDVVKALQSRRDECQADQRYVIDYVDLLEIEG